MTIKEIEEKLQHLNDLYVHHNQNEVYLAAKNVYEELLKTINILKSIESFEPDPLGIDPYAQIAAHAKWAARDYLKKIKEL